MRLVLIFLIVFTAQKLVGQDIPAAEKKTSSSELPASEAELPPVPKKDSPFGFFKMFSGNPGKAALYSAILPSAGQLYNKNYWKVPFVLAAEGTAVYLIIDNTRNFRAWRDGHRGLVEGTISPPFRGATNASQARVARDQWQQRRDFAIIGTVAIHIIQIADAFIHRHLVEFDVSDDLSFNAYTTGQSIGLVLSF